MEIIVRRVTKEDAETISVLCSQLGYPMSVEQTLKNISGVLDSRDQDAFAAEIDNKVIGWIGLSQSIKIEVPPYCEVHGLVVDDNFQNHGIGKKLIEKAKQWAKERGNDKLKLHCNVIRKEAHLFYEHLGFKETKQQKVYEIKI